MANTQAIRRRIRSVKNTAQITRAVQLVAASRMRRAQEAVEASRPFSEKIRQVLADIGNAGAGGEGVMHPLLERRDVRNAELVLMTSDRGLAGGLNANVIRLGSRYILDEAGVPVRVISVGRKGRDYMVRYGRNVVADYSDVGDRPDIGAISPVAHQVTEDFENGTVDAVYVAYTEYVSTISQRPRLVKVLPIEPPSEEEMDEAARTGVDYLFEPDPRQLLGALLPRYVEVQLYQALLESKASEFAARMIAMRNATDNANEIVQDLTLTYNKVRQANITREIIEVSSGAAALGG